MAHIQLISGIRFDLESPDNDDIRVEDIAHALGNICRFGGHAKQFYSVAQHSVYTSYLVTEPFAMAALLHDATEAYLGDVVRPLKKMLPEYKRMEEALGSKIAHSFGLTLNAFELEEVKHADNLMQAMECLELCTTPSIVLNDLGFVPDMRLTDIDKGFTGWPPAMARDRFLWRFRSLLANQNEGVYA